MFTAIANKGLIAQNATTVAVGVRDALIAAVNYYNGLAGQLDADLIAIGFTAGDITLMRSMAADLNALGSNVYHGAAPGGAYTLPYNFAASSNLIIGPMM